MINADKALYRIEISRNCIKIHQMTKSKKVKNLPSYKLIHKKFI